MFQMRAPKRSVLKKYVSIGAQQLERNVLSWESPENRIRTMQKCDITGKGKQYGNNVSFSQRHTKKVWKPNLQTKTLTVDGKKVTLKVSTQALRTLKKKGLLV